MKRLMRNGDTILRVLEVSDEQALVIDCQKRTMPVWMAAAKLADYAEISEDELHEARMIKKMTTRNIWFGRNGIIGFVL